MIVAPTQKLYFNKFIYAIKFNIVGDKSIAVRNNIIIRQIKNKLKDSGIAFRSRVDWNIKQNLINITFSVYLSDTKVYNDLLSLYPQQITWTSKPLSDAHKELLETKIEVIIREKLLYNRFKYKVMFKVGWHHNNYKTVKNWVANAFEDRPSGRNGDYIINGSWIISLYLLSNEDLMYVKMSLSDYISNIVRVDTLKEHGI